MERTISEKLRELKRYYAEKLAEDPIEGSKLDCAVFDALDKLAEEFAPEDSVPAGALALGS